MDRKTTIKILRDITRKLKDDSLFYDGDFNDVNDSDLGYFEISRVNEYIKKRLKL